MRRFLIRLGIALGALAIIVVAFGGLAPWAMTLHFNPSPPAKDFPRPKTALEAQRQDLEYFSKLLALDHAFSPAARGEANKRIAALEHLPEALPHQRFRVALMEIAALADTVYVMSKRPGRIVLTRQIDIPRPRSLATTFEPHFVDIVHELRSHIGAIRSQAATTAATAIPQ